MHVLAVNSVSTLLNYLSEHLQTTPPLQELKRWITDLEEVPNDDDDNSDADHISRTTGIVVSTSEAQIVVSPSEAQIAESHMTKSVDESGKVAVFTIYFSISLIPIVFNVVHLS